ncbi:cytochrome C assembly family protein [Suttonella ornithocola]|uniref:ABC-type uncharacterized transport system, permease component n=1 Tax=Suttonella ornithocola TaxID=279832 RepID=A0A380MT50_9GAMM|nr:cytochrome c biogenesis protein CcsA [Suttonella ornithocola]SUO95458.1 ABC-type uncharacterized transport system, permease component [Suttonella ornithocola]
MQLLLPFLVICLYLGTAWQFYRATRSHSSSFTALAFLFAACQLHAFLLITTIGNTLNFSIFNVVSAFAWSVAVLSFFWLWKKQMALGGVIISIVNASLVVLAAVFVSRKPFLSNLQGGMIWHILLSMAAWTVLTIALIHNVLFMYLFQRLKNKRLKNTNLASLANLERISVLYLLLGFLLLLAALMSGWMFVENLFAQHLWHKTVLTMLSAAVYGWTLFLYYGRHYRGLIIVYWAFAAYALLMMGYVISNIVLQFFIK